MKLWLLRRKPGCPLWTPWYDKAVGFVVRAETVEQARQMAGKDAGDEGPDAWTNPYNSTCTELTEDGDAGVIIQDFASA